MATLPKLISGVLFATLLVFVAIVLVGREPEASTGALLALAVIVLLAFSLPILILMMALRQRAFAVEEQARSLRHIAVGDVREPQMSTGPPELQRAVELVREEVERLIRANEVQRANTAEILNGIGEGVLAIDADRRVRLLNRRAERLFGIDYRPDGKRLREVVRTAALNDAFDLAIEEGKEWRARSSVQISADTRQIEIRVFPLGDRSAEIAAVALLIDVSEIERLQNIRREFLADFHHEVRTPLAGLRLAVETLERGENSAEQIEQMNRVIQRQVRRLERLVDEVGQLNEIESGDVILQREPTELRQLLQDVAADFAERAAAAGTPIVIGEGKAVVEIDPAKTQQVFANLIDNALKHSQSRAITLAVIDDERDAIVNVSDEGTGIAPEHLERIFQRFYRVEKARSASIEGTGLGLAIAKHLMLRHGGSISVVSTPGEGTTFSLHFPKRPV